MDKTRKIEGRQKITLKHYCQIDGIQWNGTMVRVSAIRFLYNSSKKLESLELFLTMTKIMLCIKNLL